MSFSNLNFEECENKIHQIITNVISKYRSEHQSVNPKDVVRDLKDADECIKEILTSAAINHLSSKIQNIIVKVENNKPVNMPNDSKEELYKKLKSKITQIDLEYRKTLKQNISLNRTLETIKTKAVMLEKQLKHTSDSLILLQQQINTENKNNECITENIESMKKEINSTLDNYSKMFNKTPINTPIEIKARSLTPILLSSMKSTNKRLNINHDDDYAKQSLSFSRVEDDEE